MRGVTSSTKLLPTKLDRMAMRISTAQRMQQSRVRWKSSCISSIVACSSGIAASLAIPSSLVCNSFCAARSLRESAGAIHHRMCRQPNDGPNAKIVVFCLLDPIGPWGLDIQEDSICGIPRYCRCCFTFQHTASPFNIQL